MEYLRLEYMTKSKTILATNFALHKLFDLYKERLYCIVIDIVVVFITKFFNVLQSLRFVILHIAKLKFFKDIKISKIPFPQ